MPRSPSSIALPASILAGSAMIAAGLYFGLRAQAPDPGVAAAPAPAEPAEARAQPLALPAPGAPGQLDSAAMAPRSALKPEVAVPVAPPDAADEPEPSVAPEPAPEPPAPEPVIPDLPAPPDPVAATATRLASDALAGARPTILEKCWRPVVTASPGLDHSTYDYDVTFDGQTGAAIALGISEHRGASRPDVAGCLRDLPLDLLQIEPQGRNVGVKVRLTLP